MNTRDTAGKLKDISVLWFQRISLGPAKRLFVFTMTPRLTHFGTGSVFFSLLAHNVANYFSGLAHSFLRRCSELHLNQDDGVFLYGPFFICVKAKRLKAFIPDTRP